MATNSDEGNPALTMVGESARDNHWVSLSMIADGRGQFGESLSVLPLASLSLEELGGLNKDALKAELKARKLKYGDSKEELKARLHSCLEAANASPLEAATPAATTTDPAASTAAATTAATAAATTAATAAAVVAAALAKRLKQKWLSEGSAMRAAWGRPDGFAQMRHRRLFVGATSATTAYGLELMHAAELRFVGGFWARLLRLARMIDAHRKAVGGLAALDIFATLSRLLEDAGLHLSNSCGSWHIRQLHGAQVRLLFERLDIQAVANAFPPL